MPNSSSTNKSCKVTPKLCTRCFGIWNSSLISKINEKLSHALVPESMVPALGFFFFCYFTTVNYSILIKWLPSAAPTWNKNPFQIELMGGHVALVHKNICAHKVHLHCLLPELKTFANEYIHYMQISQFLASSVVLTLQLLTVDDVFTLN